jgi:hypothetical protein
MDSLASFLSVGIKDLNIGMTTTVVQDRINKFLSCKLDQERAIEVIYKEQEDALQECDV